MLAVVPVSVFAAASSWSPVTAPTSVFGLACPPSQPPPMPDVSEDMPLQPVSIPPNTTTAAYRHRRAIVLPSDCVTTPLSEPLPGLSRTGIPYSLVPSGHRPTNQSL